MQGKSVCAENLEIGGAQHFIGHQCFCVFAVVWIDSSAQVSWLDTPNIKKLKRNSC